MDIRDRISEIMKFKEWSMYRLAKESGMNTSTVLNWFNKSAMPTYEALIAVSKAFHITLAELVAEHDIIELTDDIRPFVQRWSLLSEDQRGSIVSVMDSFIKSSK